MLGLKQRESDPRDSKYLKLYIEAMNLLQKTILDLLEASPKRGLRRNAEMEGMLIRHMCYRLRYRLPRLPAPKDP